MYELGSAGVDDATAGFGERGWLLTVDAPLSGGREEGSEAARPGEGSETFLSILRTGECRRR
jgi:hypothetical protein